jgi:hypothetical protein
MHDPRKQQLAAIKRIMSYVKGMISHGLHLHSSSPASMVTYTDTDWAGCPDTDTDTNWSGSRVACSFISPVPTS